ncbi:phage tail tape measure protein [Bacteroides zhangwenhongii]|uniref:Phage tail tape measure protein n=1 Tax=Bacteroides zhangwenhongii TaxID=2650157 RepID=A0ABT5H5K3_9BACE|nr:phage tail tape measure protein [Bacteroides zhangwenhongii]MDC7135865.1 phage tail tape measure protein [Bacteroides zhangwenhongii]
MNGQAKIELLLEVKNKIRTGLKQAQRDTEVSIDRMQKKMNSLKLGFIKNSKSISDEVPLIGRAFKLASNPIALAATGLLAIGKGIDYTTQKAADFNTQFRALANLNLDKTKKEVDSLQRMVLNTSFEKGFDTNKAIMGYFDVQSTTGKFGTEVRKIVERQGEFANLMQSDFNEYIAGTAKGMANFGFGVDKLDEFNRSAYATVKVGVTTFDQLAKVQSVYAGAAASNNQTFDTANKMLALFTIKTKSVDEAATLTKSMFNDLTKDATIKAFKKVGINLYDNNGKIKQADSLMLELNKKFMALDGDKKVVALKNQFSGSEGLIAMIQAATDKSGQLQNTFNTFASTKLDLDKSIELAKNDLNYKNEILKNKLNAMEIEIGTSLLPLKYKIAELKLAVAELVGNLTLGKNGLFQKGAAKANDKYMELVNNAQYMSKEEFIKNSAAIKLDIAQSQRNLKQGQRNNVKSSLLWLGNPIALVSSYMYKSMLSNEGAGNIEQMKKLDKLLLNTWKKATNSGKNIAEIKKAENTADSGNTSNTSTVADNLDAVTNSARQVRNLTVNIEAFNKGGINTQNTNLKKMDEKEIEDWFTEMCMRVVRSLEMAY